jgi:hypothetical protein
MKTTHFPSIALALLLLVTARLRAADAPATADVDWTVTLGCRHCHFAEQTGITRCTGNCGAAAATKDDKIVLLTGAAVPKDFKKGGRWHVRGALSADGKTLAVSEMTEQKPTAEELKEDKPAAAAKDEKPATPASDAKPFTGPVGRTGAGLPTLTAADADKTRYGLKPSKAASVATRYTLTRIGAGDLTGAFTATGSTYEDDSRKWIVVDSLRPADTAEAKPRP